METPGGKGVGFLGLVIRMSSCGHVCSYGVGSLAGASLDTRATAPLTAQAPSPHVNLQP